VIKSNSEVISKISGAQTSKTLEYVTKQNFADKLGLHFLYVQSNQL